MALRLKLLVIGVFLLLTTLSFCQAKNSTVKVVGLIHCTDCIKNQSSSSHTSLGYDVFIICKARTSETKTQGNGAVDKQGKFNVTLSDEITEDPSSIDGCYAKLQSNSSAPCPIQGAQTASVKILSNNVTKTVMNRPTIIHFSPITCQSAFFWPFPNFTYFATPPPPEYTPPPPQEDLPPLGSPVQPPLPPPENSTPQPSYDPPAPQSGAQSPPPSSGSPPPTPPPTYQDLPTPTTSPSQPPQAPPPLPPPQAPAVNNPIQSPAPPKSPSYTPNQAPPPTPALSPPPSPPVSKQEKPIPPPPSFGIYTPPSRRRPSPIPRAPPIPRLPLTPSVPRKYFNAPKSKSKPPRYD